MTKSSAGKRLVIVGGGVAGLNAAVAARGQDPSAHIALISAEATLPYYRPELSKAFLRGAALESGFELKSVDEMVRLGIAWFIDQRVEHIDLAGGRLRVGKEQQSFDRLLLAPGALAIRLAVPGRHLMGVCTLRSLEDGRWLRARIASARSIVIIGAGLIGMELAATLHHLGCAVTVIEQGERAMARCFPAILSAAVIGHHQAQGIRLLFDTQVLRFAGADDILTGVETSAGIIEADLAIVAIGAVPDQKLAAAAGLHCDDGIIIDRYCRTSADNVFAAGDATRMRTDVIDARHEAWRHAEDQGRIAGSNLAGGEEAYRSVPWFWSDQGRLHLQGCGTMRDAAEQVVRVGPDKTSRVIFQLDRGRLIAGFALSLDGGMAKELPFLARLVAAGARIEPVDLADPAMPLKSLARKAA